MSSLLALLVWPQAGQAEVTVLPSGEIVIPKTDWEIQGGAMTTEFEISRWGMYTLAADGEDEDLHGGDEGLQATVNGEEPKRGGQETLGDFYIAKAGRCVIAVKGESVEAIVSVKLTPTWEGEPIVQKEDEAIELDAGNCRIEGVMLRYEPHPKKRCIGYWGNPNDSPHWEFTVTTPGTYEVILTQGCGKGAGGSAAVVECGGATIKFTVRDTGGWQNWIVRPLGTMRFEKAGKHGLTVRVVKKAKGIMDIRRIVLEPVEE